MLVLVNNDIEKPRSLALDAKFAASQRIKTRFARPAVAQVKRSLTANPVPFGARAAYCLAASKTSRKVAGIIAGHGRRLPGL